MKHEYVVLDPGQTDPTYTTIEDSVVVLSESDMDLQDNYSNDVGDFIDNEDCEIYSIKKMVEVLRENGLLKDCKTCKDG